MSLGAVFRFAVNRGYMEKNYAEGFKPKKRKRPDQQQEIFNTEDLSFYSTQKNIGKTVTILRLNFGYQSWDYLPAVVLRKYVSFTLMILIRLMAFGA
jgi:hypothetical protein